jgi:hypothetical protein
MRDMTICEAAGALAQDGQPLRAQTIYALLRDGRLEGEKDSQGRWCIDAASVERYKWRRNLRRIAFRQALQDGVIDVQTTTMSNALALRDR